MPSRADELDALAAESVFSGVVRVDRSDEGVVEKAYGSAHRGYEIPNATDTRFAIASGVEGVTALAGARERRSVPRSRGAAGLRAG
jgi:CubicO group peptidase (beta-lactamase class C family)